VAGGARRCEHGCELDGLGFYGWGRSSGYVSTERVVSGCFIWVGAGSSQLACDQRRGVRVVVCLQHWLGGEVHWIEGVDFMFLYARIFKYFVSLTRLKHQKYFHMFVF
jgi:hypothetical protein